jgi:subtilisin family serine protease
MNETHYTSRRLLCVIISYTLIVTTLTATPGSASKSTATNPAKANAVNVPAQAAKTRPDAPKREGELLVRFRNGVSEQVKNTLLASKGARRKGKARGESGLETIELGQGRSVSQAVAELSLDPSVELVEPNFLVTRDQAAPNDPRFSEQWSLNNAGQSGGFPGSDVHAPAAWRTTTGSYSTIIAVVDGGVDFSSPELKNNVWKNTAEIAANGLDDDNDGLTDDVHGWNWV